MLGSGFGIKDWGLKGKWFINGVGWRNPISEIGPFCPYPPKDDYIVLITYPLQCSKMSNIVWKEMNVATCKLGNFFLQFWDKLWPVQLSKIKYFFLDFIACAL